MADSCPLRVDHVGILGNSAQDLARVYRRLGFQVVGPAELEGVDKAGRRFGLGQQSAHIMFGSDYIELTSVSSTDPDHHLAGFLQQPGGLRLVILATDHIDDAHVHCAQQGMNPGTLSTAARQVTYGSRDVARFRWFGLPPDRFAEGLIGYVQHQSWSVIFQKEVAIHSNSTLGIDELWIRAAEVPQRYQLLADEDPASVTLRAVSEKELAQKFARTLENRPPLAGLCLRVASLDATISALTDGGIEHIAHEQSVAVAPDSAGGVGLIFRQAS